MAEGGIALDLEKTDKVKELTDLVKNLCSRIDNLESNASCGSRPNDLSTADRENEQLNQSPHQGPFVPSSNAPLHLDLEGPSANLTSTAALDQELNHDIQKDFDSIRDQVSRYQLPNNLRVVDNSRGIKNDLKGQLQIIKQCARFAETGLKVIGASTSREEDQSAIRADIEKLYTVLCAQIQFLQSEYANLVVKSTFNEETSRLFRSFENNTSAFTQQSLQNIRIAAELASITQPSPPRRRQAQPAYRGNPRTRPRPFNSFQSNRRDYFQRPPTDDQN